MKCGVCNGQGDYPVIDSNGRTRRMIQCPECFGSGEEDAEAVAQERADEIAARRAALQRAKYDAAMAEKRKA